MKERKAILYTPEVVCRIRRNNARYEWAKGWIDWEKANSLAAMDDEALWTLPPSQDVGRAGVSGPWYPGCARCGAKGSYTPISPLTDWKVRCRQCGEVFPKNDFVRFYVSGLDLQGIFRRNRADVRLLFNAEYPDSSHSLHRFAVDDGTGWMDAEGKRHFFIAIVANQRWESLLNALQNLARAYLLSGEKRHAHKALLLLYRFADLYPEMDFDPYARLGAIHNHGGSGQGRIFGRISECGVASGCSEAYDMVRDAVDGDPELLNFLSAKTGKPQTPESVRQHIETNLLREFLRSFQEQPPRIRGNFGGTHHAYALTGLVLNDVEALAWLFSPDWGENLERIFTHYVSSDGMGAEGSPGYSIGWTSAFLALADLLERTSLGRKFSLYQRYGKTLRQMALAPRRLICLDSFTPNIGDNGTCGMAGIIDLAPHHYASAFEVFGEPLFAQYAYLANGRKVESLPLGIEHEDTEAIQGRIREVVQALGEPPPPRSDLLEGYGLLILRQGEGENRRAAWLYFGRNAHFGHCHHDQLNIGLYWRGLDLLPDLGYPDWTLGHAKSNLWVRNTISHNTVVVDRRPQGPSWSGKCLALHETSDLTWAEVEASGAYFASERSADDFVVSHTLDTAGLSLDMDSGIYRRLLCMVNLDEGFYLFDLFRVRGGTEHVWSFHTADGDVNVDGLDLKPQEEGSYLSPEVPFGHEGDNSGFQWLDAVQRDVSPPPRFSVNIAIHDVHRLQWGENPVRLQLTMLNAPGEVALARGYPPRGEQTGRWLPYLLVRHAMPKGKTAVSQFAALIEPHIGAPALASVTSVSVEPAEGAEGFRPFAVKVQLQNERTHYLFSDVDGKEERVVDGWLRLCGRFAFVSLYEGTVERLQVWR